MSSPSSAGDVVDRDGRDRRRDAAGELGRIEVGDRARSAAATADVLPEPLAADAERRHDADAGDDDPRSRRMTHSAYTMESAVPNRCRWPLENLSAIRVGRRCHVRRLAHGLCALSYAGRSIVAPRARGWPPVMANIILFSLFAVHHSVFARDRVKQAVARSFPASAAFVLCVDCEHAAGSGLRLWQPIGGVLYDGPRSARRGTRGRSACRRVAHRTSVGRIDALELAGIRPARPRGALQVGGPYRLVRHPLYLGWMLAVFGAAADDRRSARIRVDHVDVSGDRHPVGGALADAQLRRRVRAIQGDGAAGV